MTFNVLTDSRYGQMLYNRFDAYVGASVAEYGEFSPGEGRLFAQIITPDMLVIEVGANVGALTLALAKHARHVIALEPQLHPFYLLCANVALNSVDNVTCMNRAAGANIGTVYFPNVDPSQPCNFGGGHPESKSDTTYPVPCITLDIFQNDPVDFIKIDVEGQERAVIVGAYELLQRKRPVLYVENDREEHSAGLIKDLRHTFKYDLFWHKPPLYEPGNWKGSTADLWPGIGSFNMLCIPKERGIVPEGMTRVE